MTATNVNELKSRYADKIFSPFLDVETRAKKEDIDHESLDLWRDEFMSSIRWSKHYSPASAYAAAKTVNEMMDQYVKLKPHTGTLVPQDIQSSFHPIRIVSFLKGFEKSGEGKPSGSHIVLEK